MRSRIVSNLRLAALAAALLGTILTAGVRPTLGQQQDLPTAESLIEAHLKAIGGKQKLTGVTSFQMEGKVEVPQVGITGKIKMTAQPPDKCLTVVEMEGIGTQKTGTDGTTVWELSEVMGGQILEGERAEQVKMQAHIDSLIDVEKYYGKVETTGEETVDGKECYVVTATREGREPVTLLFSKESGLMVGTRMTVSTAFGDIDITSSIESYREHEGVKFPEKLVMSLPNNLEQIITIESVKFGVEIPAGTFDLPDEIKALKD